MSVDLRTIFGDNSSLYNCPIATRVVILLFGDRNTKLRLNFIVSSRVHLEFQFLFRFLLISAWLLLFISRLNVLRGRNIFKGGSL